MTWWGAGGAVQWRCQPASSRYSESAGPWLGPGWAPVQRWTNKPAALSGLPARGEEQRGPAMPPYPFACGPRFRKSRSFSWHVETYLFEVLRKRR